MDKRSVHFDKTSGLIMDNRSLDNMLWVVIACLDNEMGVCGVFSSEEIANAKIEELRASYENMDFWICPTDIDVLIGSEEDRLADMPNRVYQIHDMEIEVEMDVSEKLTPFKKQPIDRKGLRVVK